MTSSYALFLLMSFAGPLVTLSSSNWIVCWIGVELGFIGMIPLLSTGSRYFALNKESALKYFVVQALGSAMLFIGGLFLYVGCMNFGYSPADFQSLFSHLIFYSLLIKLGAFPGHFWVLGVVTGLEWFPFFLLLSWQKIAPFMIMINVVEASPYLETLTVSAGGIGAFAGALIGLNQTNFRGVLGASSITHTGWALVAIVYGSFWLYFGLYCLSFGLTILFIKLNVRYLSSVSIMSLSGLPPFLLFIGKWKVLSAALASFCSPLPLALLMLSALVSLFFYLKFVYSFYLDQKSSSSLRMYSVVLLFFVLNLVGSWYLVMM